MLSEAILGPQAQGLGRERLTGFLAPGPGPDRFGLLGFSSKTGGEDLERDLSEGEPLPILAELAQAPLL